jgi:four helix bundle suffix protein
MATELFKNSTGYKRLDVYILMNIIQLETLVFCRRFLSLANDPCGRQFDQMTQAARSGRANLIEGSENTATSKETEIKLLGVAKASLAELLGDYEMWLAFSNRLPWTKEESGDVFRTVLDPAPQGGDDALRDSAVHVRTQRAKFSRWLDDPDPCVRANCLLVLIRRTVHMLQRQLHALGETFAETGGLREKMATMRIAARSKQQSGGSVPDPDTPNCPKCGRPMRKRIKRDTGEAFWGCTGYAEGCRGTRPMA